VLLLPKAKIVPRKKYCTYIKRVLEFQLLVAEGKYHGSYTFFVLADVSSLSSRSSIHFSQYVEVTAVEDLRFS
jgi:hypothetical protein